MAVNQNWAWHLNLFSMARVKGNKYTFRGGNSVKAVFPPFCKGLLSKEQKVAFQKGFGMQGSKQEVIKVVLLVQNGRKSTIHVQNGRQV